MKPTAEPRVRGDAVLAGVLAALLCGAGCGRLGEGAPTDVVLAAASDTTVRISWAAPGGNLPDSYVIAFMETGTSEWLDVAGATDSATQADHNSLGRTGRYRVTAVYGGRPYPATGTPTSTPVYTVAMAVGELNSAVFSGYGWGRDSGAGSLFTMEYASNASRSDFYITDWAAGFAGPDYYVASPDWGPYEPGGLVPAGSWRPNWFRPLAQSQLPLPPFDSTVYANNLRLAPDSTLVAVVCTDTTFAIDTTLIIHANAVIDTTFVIDTLAIVNRHYGVARFGRPDTVTGTVQVETWFQLISDLRLIQH